MDELKNIPDLVNKIGIKKTLLFAVKAE